jgi:hypothetical protein
MALKNNSGFSAFPGDVFRALRDSKLLALTKLLL